MKKYLVVFAVMVVFSFISCSTSSWVDDVPDVYYYDPNFDINDNVTVLGDFEFTTSSKTTYLVALPVAATPAAQFKDFTAYARQKYPDAQALINISANTNQNMNMYFIVNYMKNEITYRATAVKND